jgi:integrase
VDINMADNLRKQGNIFHARMIIPADVREHFPGRNGKPQTAFMASTGLTDRAKAAKKAQEFIVGWRKQIELARKGEDAHAFAKRWKQTFENLEDCPAAQEAHIAAMDEELDTGIRRGYIKPAETIVARNVALGRSTMFAEHKEGFLATYRTHAQATQDIYRSGLAHFLKEFSTPEEVTNLSLKAWVRKLADQHHLAESTISRAKNLAQAFWEHMVDVGAFKPEGNPFSETKIRMPRTAKKTVHYVPYTVAEVLQLLEDAKDKRDDELVWLIELGRYTGARIEELCMVKKSDVHPSEGWFRIADSKTEAGIREVPIHAELLPVIKDLMKSKGDYLLPGLTVDKRGDRSKAIGKRFGRLKAEYWKDRAHCFHSFRKTVVTLLERAGVAEGVVADIVGHEKQTITFGLYSGGSSMDQKKTALAQLTYRT